MSDLRVGGVDHVNISTTDLAVTKQFYADLLGLTPGPMPMGLPEDYGCWLLNSDGQAILHVVRRDVAAGPTGPIDHVSIRVTGKEALLARLGAMRQEYRVYAPEIGPTLIFTHDPHGIQLELNLAEG
jgi:catechol 2,3-dioxygenase-like lactoylglutathione lyase family enzyme